MFATFSSQRSSSHSRECEPQYALEPDKGSSPQSPLARRPLPEVPSPGQRSLISDIYRWDNPYHDVLQRNIDIQLISCITKIHSRGAERGLLRPCGLRGEVPAEVPDPRVSVEPSTEDGDQVTVCHTGNKGHGDY